MPRICCHIVLLHDTICQLLLVSDRDISSWAGCSGLTVLGHCVMLDQTRPFEKTTPFSVNNMRKYCIRLPRDSSGTAGFERKCRQRQAALPDKTLLQPATVQHYGVGLPCMLLWIWYLKHACHAVHDSLRHSLVLTA